MSETVCMHFSQQLITLCIQTQNLLRMACRVTIPIVKYVEFIGHIFDKKLDCKVIPYFKYLNDVRSKLDRGSMHCVGLWVSENFIPMHCKRRIA